MMNFIVRFRVDLRLMIAAVMTILVVVDFVDLEWCGMVIFVMDRSWVVIFGMNRGMMMYWSVMERC